MNTRNETEKRDTIVLNELSILEHIICMHGELQDK